MSLVATYQSLFDRKYAILNVCFFVNSTAGFALIPLLTIYLLSEAGLSVEFITVLAVTKAWAHYAFSFLCIPIIRITGIRASIIMALLLKSLCVLGIAFFHAEILLLTFVLMNGLMSSLFRLASKLYIQHAKQDIVAGFSARYTINNFGAAIAPLFVTVSLFLNMPAPYLISALSMIFLLLSLFAFQLEEVDTDTGGGEKKFVLNWQEILSIGPFTMLASTFFAVFYFMFETALPVQLTTMGMEYYIGPLLFLNAVMIIVLQIPVFSWSSQEFGLKRTLLGVYAICLILSLPFFLNSGVLFNITCMVIAVTFAELISTTAIDCIIAQNTSTSSDVLYSLTGLCHAIGIGIGGLLFMIGGVFAISVCVVIFAVLVILGGRGQG